MKKNKLCTLKNMTLNNVENVLKYLIINKNESKRKKEDWTIEIRQESLYGMRFTVFWEHSDSDLQILN